jgi:hypothetical protein
MAVKPTAAEVIEEGMLKLEYFPNLSDDTDLTTFIDSRIDDVDDYVQLQVGASYNSADGRITRQLHKAEVYLTLSRLWQIIKNVMDAYDEESLPPEFVEPEQAAANRDYYQQEGLSIIARYDATIDEPGFRRPYFGTAGVSADSRSMLQAWTDLLYDTNL